MKMDRKDILLKAAYDMLKKCREAYYVISPMEVTVFYDDADCDGFCLMEDIAHELGLDDNDDSLS
jgi:hypothetical protein